MRLLITIILSTLLLHTQQAMAQQFYKQTPAALKWTDSVFNSLSPSEKVAQLMIVRAHSNLGSDHVQSVTNLVKQYNIGGLCFFQGGPVRQANLTNYYQRIAKTPLMVCIDGEWGLGMRLDSVINLPRQMMLGAVPDANTVYEYGKAVGEQCKRIGVHVNYAPVVDVNNNPLNPVINDRSFGEDKYKVSLYGIAYMRGMQDAGVMACAKHFPGHGDVTVDSHYDLPVINKDRQQLDSLELYPFRQMFKEGVGSVMIAHLYIPSIDSTENLATSLSKNNVTNLLRHELGYEGITFTDALEMKGVTKFFPDNEASVQSIIAGNDMLCLPVDVPGSIQKILQAIDSNRISWQQVDASVRKVLLAKYHLGLNRKAVIDTTNLLADINRQTVKLKAAIARESATVLSSTPGSMPIKGKKKIAYIGLGTPVANSVVDSLNLLHDVVFHAWDYKTDSVSVVPFLQQVRNGAYDLVIAGVHTFSRRPANNFGLPPAAIALVRALQDSLNSTVLVFGNPYAAANFRQAGNLVTFYEDDEYTRSAAVDLLAGRFEAKGKLPVSIADGLSYGSGNTYNSYFPYTAAADAGMNTTVLDSIDLVVQEAMAAKATPGAVVLVAKDGKIVFNKAYGNKQFGANDPVTIHTIYDVASLTKTTATTVAVMKLYEQGLLNLNKSLSYYLPFTKGTDKANLKLIDILSHKAGLNPFIPFYAATLDADGVPRSTLYRATRDEYYSIKVAEDLYLRNDYPDTMMTRILSSRLLPYGKYVYSDNDFILLGKIVEAVSGQTLDSYVASQFFQPLNMASTAFNAADHFPLSEIAPTANEKNFRMQLIHGYVHDPGAAMFGGVAGHAGLFSTAYDVAQLYQMLLNGGVMNGKRYLQEATIRKFTAYNNKKISRRALGFDKPDPNNAKKPGDEYPTLSASQEAFGHTGFTGTCVWADPKYNLVYVFLSNRVNAEDKNVNKLNNMSVRGTIHELIYRSLGKSVDR